MFAVSIEFDILQCHYNVMPFHYVLPYIECLIQCVIPSKPMNMAEARVKRPCPNFMITNKIVYLSHPFHD